MLAALSTGHKIGLLTMAVVFIAFALASSFVVPRYRPQFPSGWRGVRYFVLVTLLVFGGMLAAVIVFGSEPKEARGGEEASSAPSTSATTNAGTSAAVRRVPVTESEWKVTLPQATLSHGSYEFNLRNDGQVPHDLTITGPQVSKAATPVIGPGKGATLKVTLVAGDYDFYCSVPGHKQLGMDLKVTVT